MAGVVRVVRVARVARVSMVAGVARVAVKYGLVIMCVSLYLVRVHYNKDRARRDKAKQKQ